MSSVLPLLSPHVDTLRVWNFSASHRWLICSHFQGAICRCSSAVIVEFKMPWHFLCLTLRLCMCVRIPRSIIVNYLNPFHSFRRVVAFVFASLQSSVAYAQMNIGQKQRLKRVEMDDANTTCSSGRLRNQCKGTLKSPRRCVSRRTTEQKKKKKSLWNDRII